MNAYLIAAIIIGVGIITAIILLSIKSGKKEKSVAKTTADGTTTPKTKKKWFQTKSESIGSAIGQVTFLYLALLVSSYYFTKEHKLFYDLVKNYWFWLSPIILIVFYGIFRMRVKVPVKFFRTLNKMIVIFVIAMAIITTIKNSKGEEPDSSQTSITQESSTYVPPPPIYEKELAITGEWQTLKTVPYKNYRYQFNTSEKIEWRYKGYPKTKEELTVLKNYSAMNIRANNPGNIPAQVRSISGQPVEFLLTITRS